MASLLVLLMGFCGTWLVSAQQSTVAGSVKNFKVAPDFYPPPNNRQMKSLLEGAEASPQPGGRIVVRNARLQTFRANGDKELHVETPECIYTEALKSVSSSAPLKAFTADGRFSMAGTGFLWSQTNSSLIISNKITTVLQPEMLAQSSAQPAPGQPGPGPITIQAESFDYLTETGIGTYRDNVSVTGTNLSMNAARLSFDVPFAERQLRSITAEENVALDYQQVHATGGKAVYTTVDERVRVTGDPKWSAQEREGSARELIIERTNRVFRGEGEAYVKLAGQGLKSVGFLTSDPATNSAAPGGPQIVEIRSDFYQLTTNEVVFGDSVRLVQSEGGVAKGGLQCGTLTVAFSTTNQIEQMTAEKGVVIDQGEVKLLGDVARYKGETGLLLLQGNPRWEAGARKGSGDLITVDARKQQMLVTGSASMEMPAEDIGQSTVLPGAPGVVKVLPPAGTPGPQVAEIFSETYSFQRQAAVFSGGVYISHPRMAWACETFYINFSSTRKIDSVVADQSVAFDLAVAQGQQVRGRAGRAFYQYSVAAGRTNDLVELTGSPVLETTNIVFQNSVFILDRANNKLVAPGRYRLRGSAEGFNTNFLKLPDMKALQPKRPQKKR